MIGAPAGSSIVFSIRTGLQRDGDLRATVDPAYMRLYDGFVDAWLRLGHRAVEVVRPEIHPASADRRTMFGCERPLHVIFKDAEDIRVLKGAYNIGAPVLDEPRLRCCVSANRPFSNHLRMFELLDEIWVGSACAADSLRNAGLANVHVVPCPLPHDADRTASSRLPCSEISWFANGRPTDPGFGASVSPGTSGDTTVFVASFDAADETVDLGAMIDAFLALETRTTLLLVAGEERTYQRLRECIVERQIAALKTNTFVSGLVGLVSPRMSGRDRAALYATAGFYLCVSRFTSETSPMREAMRQGCIPVTVRHSAISELIAADHPLLIENTRGVDGFAHADRANCTRAMVLAAALPAAARTELAARARGTALNAASPSRLEARLQALRPDRHG